MFSEGNLMAQNIQVLMSPKPSPYISDWQQQTETVKLIVSNTTTNVIVVKIKSELLDGSSSVIAATDAAKMPELEVSPGVTTYDASDVFPLSAVNYKGKAQNSIIQTGRIPDDNYQLCVALTDPNTNTVIGTSGTVCKTFTITAFQAPTLINPINNQEIDEIGVKGIVFRWTPIIPKPSDLVTYRLQVWEVLEGQTPMIALRTNQPIVEKDCKDILQTQWPIENALPEASKKYVWTITPLDKESRKLVDGNGFSEPFSFSITTKSIVSRTKPLEDTTKKHDEEVVSGSGGGSGLRTSSGATDPDTLGTLAVGNEILAGEDGEFIVKITQITTNTDGSFTGKGRVRVNWLKAYLGVEFKEIRVSSAKRLKIGAIVSSQSGNENADMSALPQAWGTNLLSSPAVADAADKTLNWTNNNIIKICDWIDTAVFDSVRINYSSSLTAPDVPVYNLKVPFGLSFNGSESSTIVVGSTTLGTIPALPPFTLAITEMVFKPNESKINFLNKQEFDYNGSNYKLGFAGKYFHIHQNKIEFAEGRVELAEDFTCPNFSVDPKMEFTFKAVEDEGTGTYIQWCDTGILDLGVQMEVAFSRDWLTPLDDDGEVIEDESKKAIAVISGNGTTMKDILLSGGISNCEIVGTNGLQMMADSIGLDFSKERNFASIEFPENYAGETSELWRGFYIKTFALTLPDKWKNASATENIEIEAENVIIDDFGITTDISIINVIPLNNVKIANFSASIDTIQVSIIASSLESGKASGLLVLPISQNTIANTLKYSASFSQVEVGNLFQIVINPYQDIQADVFRGKMTINETSNILLKFLPNAINADVCLNGNFHWDNPNLASSSSSSSTGEITTNSSGAVGVKIDIEFENVKLLYTYIKSADLHNMNFNIGHWSFASPQKRFAHFPVTIKGVRYKSLSTGSSGASTEVELVRGAIIFDVIINLTESIGGKCAFGPVFSMGFDKSSYEFKPHFIGFMTDSAHIDANLAAVKLSGTLVMFDNDPKFGNGFLATLKVMFTAVKFQINALVQFGNTSYGSSEMYRYWRCEADVMLPVGVPFLTGVGFYGFGGGAYYNMTAKTKTSIANPGNETFTFEPQKSNLGFMIKATIATMPKFETFNADVTVLAEFNYVTQGIIKLGFLGNFWVAAELAKRDKAMVKGSVAVDYNFTTKIFNMVAGVSLNVYPGEAIITTPSPINLALYIDGINNKWYFKSGTPNSLNYVNIYTVSSYSYFMFGNYLNPDVPSGFTNGFVSRYSTAVGNSPSFSGNVGSGGVGPATTSGKGFAAGVGFKFSGGVNQDLGSGLCRKWSAYANYWAGAEVDIAFLEYTACGSRAEWGINSYRMNGALGMYASVTAGISGQSFRPKLCSDKNYALLTLRCGAWVTGSFPKPVYAEGRVEGRISAFDDLVSCDFSQGFTYGEQCTSGSVSVDTDEPAQDKAADYKNSLIQYIAPNQRYNFSRTQPINVKYSLTPNLAFDVAENQGDGTIKNRTFRMSRTYTLNMQDSATGVWNNVPMLNEKLNISGDYQYFIGITTASSSISSASAFSVGSGSTLGSSVHGTATVSYGAAAHASTIVLPTRGTTLVSHSGTILSSSLDPVIPPPPVPNYPNPTPEPTNSLVNNREYKFIVTATLQELIGGVWVNATTKTGSAITESRTMLFRTSPRPIVVLSSGAAEGTSVH